MGRAEFPLEVILSAVDRVTTPLRGVQNTVTKFGATVSNYATKLSLGISAPVAGLFTMAAKQSSSVETALTRLGLTAKITGDQLQSMREAAESAAYPFANPAGIDALTALSVQEFKVQDSLKMLPGIAELAIGTQSDFLDSTQAVADTLQAWQIPAKEYQRVIDVIASSTLKTESPMREFVTHLDQLGPTANRAGIELGEAAAMLIQFERAATKTGSGGVQNPAQAAKKIFGALNANSGAAQAVFERLNIQNDEWIDGNTMKIKSMATVFDVFRKHGASAADIQELLGQKAWSPFLGALDAGHEAFRLLVEDISTAGSASKMAAAYSDSGANKMLKLGEAWKKFLNELGESGVLDAVKDLLDTLTVILFLFKKLNPGTEQWIAKLGILAIVLFPVVALLAQAVISIGAIGSGLASLAAWLGIGGSAAGGAAVVDLATGAAVAGGAASGGAATGGGLAALLGGEAGLASLAAATPPLAGIITAVAGVAGLNALLEMLFPGPTQDELGNMVRLSNISHGNDLREEFVRQHAKQISKIQVDFTNLPLGTRVLRYGPMHDVDLTMKMGTLRSAGY